MRLLPILLAAILWSANALCGPGASIRVVSGGWGAASVEDVETVLHSVADALLPDFPSHAGVRISVASSTAGPRVLAQRAPDGAHQVLLNVRDTHWDQLAYQFSHELCHIVSNYDRRETGSEAAPRPHQWFEEAVCEAVAMLALHRLASSWQSAPPHPGWDDYAPAFRRYADRLAKAEHRRLPPGMTLAAWYADRAAPLERDPYRRHDNEVAASALLALFESVPRSVAAVGYLNLQPAAGGTFEAYLEAWHDCCPEPHRPAIRRLMQLFAA